MKIGAIPFLNVKPLIYKLEIDKSVELVYEYPSTLSSLLKNEQVDAGIIPTIDYFRGAGKFVIPKICISSYGKVASVKLFYKNAISSIKEVAVDKASSTSVALLRIILSEIYSISPLFKEITPLLPQSLEENESVLLIGDHPLTLSGKSIDLGEEWYKLTQLPFVYAFWVIRDGLEDYKKIVNLIVKSKEFGIRNLDEIVRNESEKMSLSKELVTNYLKQIIYYDLGRLELKGILKFVNFALKYKLIEKEREIEFCTTSNFRYGIKRREAKF